MAGFAVVVGANRDHAGDELLEGGIVARSASSKAPPWGMLDGFLDAREGDIGIEGDFGFHCHLLLAVPNLDFFFLVSLEEPRDGNDGARDNGKAVFEDLTLPL
jgi:hypothetical protein